MNNMDQPPHNNDIPMSNMIIITMFYDKSSKTNIIINNIYLYIRIYKSRRLNPKTQLETEV